MFLIRPLAVGMAYKAEENVDYKSIMESLAPKGLAAAVLVQIPFQQGIVGAEQLLTPVFAVIFFSILLSTILVFLVQHDKYPGTSVLIKKLFHRQSHKV